MKCKLCNKMVEKEYMLDHNKPSFLCINCWKYLLKKIVKYYWQQIKIFQKNLSWTSIYSWAYKMAKKDPEFLLYIID